MQCTVVYSGDVSFAFTDVDDLTEDGLRERFGFADGEDHIEADYELTVRDDGKKVHTFFIEGDYITDAIWVIEG